VNSPMRTGDQLHGANIVVLSHEDANRIGINVEATKFTAKISTANGVVLAAPMILKEIAMVTSRCETWRP
jgi:predicted aspartyl protease